MPNMNSMTAIIIPLSSSSAEPKPQPPSTKPPSGGAPDQTLPGELPKPSHPIYYPLPPGAPVDPEYGIPSERPDQSLPGSQPKPDQSLPGAQPGIDNTLPGQPPVASTGPGFPTHPIVLPPGGGGWAPIYIWGPTDPRPGTGLPGPQPTPTPPIVLPPEGQQPQGKIKWQAVWTPTGGWQTIGVVIPEGPAPTPSKKK